jgi:Rrf2 family protein
VLRISAKVDYAVRAMAEIARGAGKPVKANEIAGRQDIPARFLGAVLTQLRRAGLVESRRGGDGGYWLARAGDQICVADVIEAIDGKVVDIRALSDPGSETQAMWAATAEGVTSLLTTYTIANLAAEAPTV